MDNHGEAVSGKKSTERIVEVNSGSRPPRRNTSIFEEVH